jgi:hypothetical protein
MSPNFPGKSRKLYSWEIDVIFPIFGNTFNYASISVHENNPLPDWIDRLGRLIKRMPAAEEGKHNAITLGNHCLFPVQLPESQPNINDPDFQRIDWLVHELTHAWQYQHIGWAYLFRALLAQLRYRAQVYDYGGADGLAESLQKGIHFLQFNPEQQGKIVQDYFLRRSTHRDVAAWEPYIREVKDTI